MPNSSRISRRPEVKSNWLFQCILKAKEQLIHYMLIEMNVFCAFTVLFLFIGGLKFVNVNCWKTKREGKEIFYYISLMRKL